MRPKEAAAAVGELLAETRMTLCTAESCTGGLIASVVTDIAGSSAYFLGGVVTYSNLSKHRLLGVPESVLVHFGAVSAPVALAMAQNARRLFGADIAVAATGIAGPTGGTAAKPVGLVYVSIATPNQLRCRRFILPHDRVGNKLATAREALNMVVQWAGRREMH